MFEVQLYTPMYNKDISNFKFIFSYAQLRHFPVMKFCILLKCMKGMPSFKVSSFYASHRLSLSSPFPAPSPNGWVEKGRIGKGGEGAIFQGHRLNTESYTQFSGYSIFVKHSIQYRKSFSIFIVTIMLSS